MQQSPILSLPITAASIIAAARFVDFAGNHAASGELPMGISAYGAAAGVDLSVRVLGTAMLEAGGAIAAGGPIKPAADGSGKGIAQAGAGPIGAYALQAAAADGDIIEVLVVHTPAAA